MCGGGIGEAPCTGVGMEERRGATSEGGYKRVSDKPGVAHVNGEQHGSAVCMTRESRKVVEDCCSGILNWVSKQQPMAAPIRPHGC